MAGLSTRVLLLTPPGAGPIGVVRLIGPDAVAILDKVFSPARAATRIGAQTQTGSNVSGSNDLLEVNRIRYGKFVDRGEVVDDVLVCRASTDRATAIDISAHGGVRIMERILESFQRLGAPLVDGWALRDAPWKAPTVMETEALSLIHKAKTERAVRFLTWQRQHLVASVRKLLSPSHFSRVGLAEAVGAMLSGYEAAQTLIHGATIVLLGPPNSGKSTLFNRIVARSAAVVSPCPGTTRDWVCFALELEGAPVSLVDTAGSRRSTDDIEQQAIEGGEAIASKADLRVIVLDGSRARSGAEWSVPERHRRHEKEIRVLNKMDLVCGSVTTGSEPNEAVPTDDAILVSARTGRGIERLTAAMAKSLGLDEPVEARPCLFTERQRRVANRVLSDSPRGLDEASAALRGGLIGGHSGDDGG